MAEEPARGTEGAGNKVDADFDPQADDADLEDWGYESPLTRWSPVVALVLSLAGFGISLYLTIEHYTGNRALICLANSVLNCRTVTTSAESMLFGIPVALLGLIFFTVMVTINLPVLWRSWPRWLAWSRLAMVLGGMGFVIYLIYAELFMIKAICLWCTGVHVVTFLLFVLVVSSFPAVAARSD
ncbi:MAG: vitamin K epoxide reductase family protein [Acidimicrobiales bacterium]